MVAIGGHHLDPLSLDPHDRDVEGAAAKIEDENGLVLVELVEPVSERRGRRLVDNLQNVEAGQLTGRDRRRALGVVEIRRHGDDRIGHRSLEVFLRIRL